MKTTIALILSILITITLPGQDLNFEWANQIEINGVYVYVQSGIDLAIDDAGNTYLLGRFDGSADLDPGPGVFMVTSTAPAGTSGYIVKLDKDGKFLWGRKIDGEQWANPVSLAVDKSGNMYIAGAFTVSIDFGPGSEQFNLSATPPTPYNYDAFILKLDTDGNIKWSKSFHGDSTYEDFGYSVTTDDAGNVFFSGAITGVSGFDISSAKFVPGGPPKNASSYAIKMNAAGDILWANLLSSTVSSEAHYSGTDKQGNLYITGFFEGVMDCDPGAGEFNLTNPGQRYFSYMIKFDPQGKLVWADTGMVDFDFTIDRDMNIITHKIDRICKYDTNGNLLWEKQAPRNTYLLGLWMFTDKITTDDAGNIYLAGKRFELQDFDPGPGVFYLPGHGMYVSKLDPDGNFLWAKSFGELIEGYTLKVDPLGNMVIRGIFRGTADFDPGPGSYTLTSPGTHESIFTLKLGACIPVYDTLSVFVCDSLTVNKVTYFKTGTYRQVLKNQQNCDSIVIINLEIGKMAVRDSVKACNQYIWEGNPITTSGVYTRVFRGSRGCDSTVTRFVEINKKLTRTISAVICNGDSLEGYTTSGTYTDTFGIAGCDSIRILQLTVLPPLQEERKVLLCEGQSYLGHSAAGLYNDHFKTSMGCDSLLVLQIDVAPSFKLNNVRTICRGQNYMGHTTTGNYVDSFVTVNGCDSIYYTSLTVLSPPDVSLGADSSICGKETILLYPGHFENYLWQDGSSDSAFLVRNEGTYSVTVLNACGSARDEIVITKSSCDIYFPTGFSPNHDGLNDQFKILNAHGLQSYELKVYNRFGEVVFKTTDTSKGWDGKFKNKIADTGAYAWQCIFRKNDVQNVLKGSVVLLR